MRQCGKTESRPIVIQNVQLMPLFRKLKEVAQMSVPN